MIEYKDIKVCKEYEMLTLWINSSFCVFSRFGTLLKGFPKHVEQLLNIKKNEDYYNNPLLNRCIKEYCEYVGIPCVVFEYSICKPELLHTLYTIDYEVDGDNNELLYIYVMFNDFKYYILYIDGVLISRFNKEVDALLCIFNNDNYFNNDTILTIIKSYCELYNFDINEFINNKKDKNKEESYTTVTLEDINNSLLSILNSLNNISIELQIGDDVNV